MTKNYVRISTFTLPRDIAEKLSLDAKENNRTTPAMVKTLIINHYKNKEL
jgi:hypothetical protein